MEKVMLLNEDLGGSHKKKEGEFMKNAKLCFYVEGDISIIDTVKNGTDRSFYENENLDQIRKRHPEANLVPYEYALWRINEALKVQYPMLEPKEITEEEYTYALEVLPPVNWIIDGDNQSFTMSERTYGDITVGYVKKGNTYYTMNCRTHTKHAELLAVCN